MSLSSRRAYHVIVAAIKEGKTVIYNGDKRVIIDYADGEEDLSYYDEEYDNLYFIYFTNYVQIVLDNGL